MTTVAFDPWTELPGRHDWHPHGSGLSEVAGHLSARCSTCLMFIAYRPEQVIPETGCPGGPMTDQASPTVPLSIGERWYSSDNGRSWVRSQYANGVTDLSARLIAYDIDGTITLKIENKKRAP